jgi:hypothetical protein
MERGDKDANGIIPLASFVSNTAQETADRPAGIYSGRQQNGRMIGARSWRRGAQTDETERLTFPCSKGACSPLIRWESGRARRLAG